MIKNSFFLIRQYEKFVNISNASYLDSFRFLSDTTNGNAGINEEGECGSVVARLRGER